MGYAEHIRGVGRVDDGAVVRDHGRLRSVLRTSAVSASGWNGRLGGHTPIVAYLEPVR